MSDISDAFDRVHPDFIDLLIRSNLLPGEEGDGLSESNLARLIYIALELAEEDEQIFLLSRIITEDELAVERLRSPEVRNTHHRVVLDRAERRAAFREAANDPAPERGNGEDCLICGEDAHVRAPCGCSYCLACYREAIRLGLRSQEEFPPRCCQPFDVEAIERARAPALVHLFRQMQEEADVPIHDRLYCHDGNCAAFIPPHCNGNCLFCDTHTCRDCGERGHPGQPCREGAAEEDVWATMDENRTVNCPGCGRMIELAEACNHISCPCGTHFCFICGRVWNHCHCPLYGGFHLMVPMRDRPGRKPQQFRRRPHRTEGAAAQRADAMLRIPQLRPMPGEEERVPLRIGGPQRVIRPLVLPPPEEPQEPQEPRRYGEHPGRERLHGERNRDAYEHERNRRRAERRAGGPMEPRRVEPLMGRDAPEMRMERQREGGRVVIDAIMPGMGRMQINEQRIERPPARDDRRPYGYYNEMDAPQIDVPRREMAYDARRGFWDNDLEPQAPLPLEAEDRRRNNDRLLAMNREAARLAQNPPRQQGRNREGQHNDHDHDVLIDSDDEIYGGPGFGWDPRAHGY